jgi:hypothetical protein
MRLQLCCCSNRQWTGHAECHHLTVSAIESAIVSALQDAIQVDKTVVCSASAFIHSCDSVRVHVSPSVWWLCMLYLDGCGELQLMIAGSGGADLLCLYT